MSIDAIDPYPWFLGKHLDLQVNDRLLRTKISNRGWVDFWRPLFGKLLDIWLAAKPRRLTVAIGGVPGSGKTVFAEQLRFLIERGLFHKEAHALALPMDGFHYPNAYLQKNTRKLPDGTEIPLSMVKGQPDTFDLKRLRTHLTALHIDPAIEDLHWPGYSRVAHDVVQDQFHVRPSANLCIVEGNYLLLDKGPFAGIPDLFDLKIYLDAPAPKVIANLMERHLAGGKTLDEAKAWVKRIDLPNARLAESTKCRADVVIEHDHEDEISAVMWVKHDRAAPTPSILQPPLPMKQQMSTT